MKISHAQKFKNIKKWVNLPIGIFPNKKFTGTRKQKLFVTKYQKFLDTHPSLSTTYVTSKSKSPKNRKKLFRFSNIENKFDDLKVIPIPVQPIFGQKPKVIIGNDIIIVDKFVRRQFVRIDPLEFNKSPEKVLQKILKKYPKARQFQIATFDGQTEVNRIFNRSNLIEGVISFIDQYRLIKTNNKPNETIPQQVHGLFLYSFRNQKSIRAYRKERQRAKASKDLKNVKKTRKKQKGKSPKVSGNRL